MNEKALELAFQTATKNGYNGTQDQFQKLLAENEDALKMAYSDASSGGYNGSIDNFNELLGLKKKDDSMVSATEDTVLGSLSSVSDYINNIAPKQEDTEQPPVDKSLKPSLDKKIFKDPRFWLFNTLAEAVASGIEQGNTSDEALSVMFSGDLSDKDIQKYIDVNTELEKRGPSRSMIEFNKDYDKAVASGDSEVWAFIEGIAKNPLAAAEVSLSSMASMATAAFGSDYGAGVVLAGGAAGAGAGAGIGAAAGAIGGPLAGVTAAGGAVTGAMRGMMSAAGGLVETTASFTDFLKEELGDKPFTKENVKAVLDDEDKKSRIVNRALSRGATIAAVDLLTSAAVGKASKVTKGLTSGGFTGKAAVGAVGATIEGAGGGAGEVAARVVADQPMDVKEIGFEVIGEIGQAPIDIAIGLRNAPKYTINDSPVKKTDIIKRIDTATDEELMSMKINIDNDEILSERLGDRMKRARIGKDIDPSITDEADRNVVIDKEIELEKLRGNKTRSAKQRAKILGKEIDDIQAKYLTAPIDKIAEDSKKKYVIDGAEVSKESFIDTINNTPKEELSKMKIEVSNDTETSNFVDNKMGVTPVVEEIKLTPQQYVDELTATKESDPEQYWSVDPVSLEDATKGNIIANEDGAAVVSNDGDIKGVFKKATSKAKRVADVLLNKAIEAGGIKLDNFDIKYLTDTYNRNGFKVVARMPFNEEYAPVGWNEAKHGRPDVVAMIYDPNNELVIDEKKFNKDQYQQMIDYRDSFVDLAIDTKKKNDVYAQEQAKLKEIAPKEFVKEKVEFDLEKANSNVLKALNRVLPDLKVTLHKTKKSYSNVVGEAKSYGAYLVSEKEIHINVKETDETTIFHEVFHALLRDKIKTDKQIQDITQKMIDAVYKNASGPLRASLDNFSRKYGKEFRNEEKLAELLGILSMNYDTLSKPQKSKIRKWISDIAKFLGLRKMNDSDVIDFFNTVSRKLREGDEITKQDIRILDYGASSNIGSPVKLNVLKNINSKPLMSTSGDHNLSFVDKKDLVDVVSLIKDIQSKGQSVWFWTADQLGRGNYYDAVIDGEHYLDAGPSFALDPNNRNKGIIWATGKSEAFINKNSSEADYIFIISGSPIKSKMFNKRVFDLLVRRVGDFDAFKKGVMDNKPTKPIKDVLEKYNNWDDLSKSPDRKKLLSEIASIEIKNTPLKQFLKSSNAFIDMNELRDGFYAENGFDMNDVLLILKPEGYGGKSSHSTYENNIKGKVIGVPNAKVNAYDILPKSIRDKYEANITESAKSQVIAPYGSGIRSLEVLNKYAANENLKNIKIVYDGIMKALYNGVSDKSIREYYSEINKSFMNDILKAAKEDYANARAKEEKLFDPKRNKVGKWLDKMYRTFMSKKGFNPISVRNEMEIMEGSIEVEVKYARKTIYRINKVLSSMKQDARNELADKIDAYIRGDQTIEIPENLLPFVNDMRMHMDNLSRKLINTGAIKANESRANILNNIGSYVNRSYQLFDDPDYVNKIPEQIKQAAENKLRELLLEQAEAISLETGELLDVVLDEIVEQSIKEILSVDDINTFINGGYFVGSKNLSILKERKEIPIELRALMGEYGDIGKNYIKTVQKTATMIANQNYLNNIAKAGKNVFFFEEKKGDFTTEIAGEKTETKNPLNGLYTTPEIAEALSDSGIFTINDKELNKAYKLWLKAVGVVKYNKTILSVGTHLKNFIGNIPFMIANWNLNPVQLKNSMNVLVNDIKNADDATLNAKLDEYIKAGIISNSAVLGEIRDAMIGTKNFDDIALKMSDEIRTKRVLNKIKKVGDFAETMYQAEDDFFKIAAYESEKARYSSILYNKPFDGLTDEQKKDVLDRSAEVVKNTLPNYNRIGKMTKIMKNIPIAGTFMSFQVEALRTAYNTVELAAKEMNDPKTRDIGIKRLKGILTIIGGQMGLMAMVGLSKHNDDDDDDFVSSVRKFLPDWNRFSNIIITEAKDGSVTYLSLSASDPHGTIVKAVNSYFSGENFKEGLINSIGEVFSPFISEDIFLNTMTNLLKNEDSYGRKIFKEGDDSGDYAEKTLLTLYKTFEPGTITSIRKITKSEEPGYETLGQATGFKPQKIDLYKQTYYLSRSISDRILEVTLDFSKAKRQYNSGQITKSEAMNVYDEVNKKRKVVLEELIGIYKSAVQLGADPDKILEKMMDGRISKKDVKGIRDGKLRDM